jgi:hypothetical protein
MTNCIYHRKMQTQVNAVHRIWWNSSPSLRTSSVARLRCQARRDGVSIARSTVVSINLVRIA